jgi:hypothetical protein
LNPRGKLLAFWSAKFSIFWWEKHKAGSDDYLDFIGFWLKQEKFQNILTGLCWNAVQ